MPDALSLAHIVCCIDRSEASDLAIAEALSLRRLAPGRLTFVHVAPPREVLVGGLTEWEVDADDPLGPPGRWLQERAAAVEGADSVLLCGDPAAGVVSAWLGEADVDLVVAAAHRSRVQRAVLGSFARQLAYESPTHVLIARGEARLGTDPWRVACCVDESEGAARALALTRQVAERARADVSLVHVISPPTATPRRLVARLLPAPSGRRRRAAELLRRHAERLPGAETVLLTGAPGPETCAWAGRAGADLLVVGPRGGGRAGLGGFASAVVTSAPCAVLLARPGG